MTTKLKDYGIYGPWVKAECDGCGKKRSCMGGKVSEDETLYLCVLCVVKDIEAYENRWEEVNDDGASYGQR